jgi:uncharacterized RDD family membrane protein YckC
MGGAEQFSASPDRRLMASALDLMLVFGLALFLSPLIKIAGLTSKFDILAAIAYLAYEASFLWLWKGQTPGRRVMSIFVLPTRGGELSYREAILRPGLRVGLFLLSLDLAYVWRYMDYGDLRIHVLLPIEVALMLSLPSRRTLADFAAGTIVVNAPPPQPHRAPAAPMYSPSDAEFGLPARPPGHGPETPDRPLAFLASLLITAPAVFFAVIFLAGPHGGAR